MALLREALPFPAMDADEKVMLTGFLEWYRDTVQRKVEGLDDAQAARRLVPSLTTPLGVVKHLAYVERGWFQSTFLDRPVRIPWRSGDPDGDFRIEPGDTVESVLSFYRAEIELSRQIVVAADLSDHARREDRREYTLRWIVVHMIEETARHAGHVDILREQIDGAVGE